jgi:hypothetical protein
LNKKGPRFLGLTKCRERERSRPLKVTLHSR